MTAELRYRVEQFRRRLRPQISAADLKLAETVLSETPAAWRLFQRMPPGDQQHALGVLRTLQRWNITQPELQSAALLHDAAKSLGQPLLYRVLVVLLEKFAPALLGRLSNAPLNCAAWRRPFVVHARHPQLGAEWAAAAGCSPAVVRLIAEHQQLPTAAAQSDFEQWRLWLYQADSQN